MKYSAFYFFLIPLLIACQPKTKEKFEWNAGISAPIYYGATAPFVEFFYQGKSIAGASASGIEPGWGTTSGGYTGGDIFKNVPDSLYVSWICDADGIQYKGGIKLPQQKMLNNFNNKITDLDGNKADYVVIASGFAPGGNVTVWMLGGGSSTEIMKFKTKKIQVWRENDKEYEKYVKEHENISEGFKTANIFRYLHGLPYSVWEKDEPVYNYDIGFTNADENNFSIIVTPLSKDGSYVFMNQDEVIIPYKDWEQNKIPNKTKKDKLPVQMSVQWVSKDNQKWYEGEIVLPNNFRASFEKFYYINKNVHIVLVMDKIDFQKDFTYGSLWLQGSTGKNKVMKFRLSRLDIETRKFIVSKYSLPKNYEFPKWEGRIPIEKPKNFNYWQEK